MRSTPDSESIENCQNTGEVIAKKINANYEVNRLNSAGGICHSNFGTAYSLS